MASALDDLKAQARILQRRANDRDPATLERLRAAGVTGEPIRRRHCLAALARELGFAGWPAVVSAFDGREGSDFGTLLYPPGCAAHWNIWCASYDDARDIREQRGEYLLAYKRQFFVADRHLIATLGLDPDDPDWEEIGRDWVNPTIRAARDRLYAGLLRARSVTT